MEKHQISLIVKKVNNSPRSNHKKCAKLVNTDSVGCAKRTAAAQEW